MLNRMKYVLNGMIVTAILHGPEHMVSENCCCYTKRLDPSSKMIDFYCWLQSGCFTSFTLTAPDSMMCVSESQQTVEARESS